MKHETEQSTEKVEPVDSATLQLSFWDVMNPRIGTLRSLMFRLRCFLLREPAMFVVSRYGMDPLNDGCSFFVVAVTLSEAFRIACAFDNHSVRLHTRRAHRWYVGPAVPGQYGVVYTKRWGPSAWGDWWAILPANAGQVARTNSRNEKQE